jgi:hypothetical protein
MYACMHSSSSGVPRARPHNGVCGQGRRGQFVDLKRRGANDKARPLKLIPYFHLGFRSLGFEFRDQGLAVRD